MRRVASLFLPHWSTDRLRRNRAHTPPESRAETGAEILATVARSGGRRMLVSVDGQAQALGLMPGMSVTDARLRVPELVLAAADAAGDAGALRALGEWALRRYAPQVALAPHGLWIETQGASHLFGGEAALLGDLLHRLARRGIGARAAIADTSGAAHALAVHGAHAATIVPRGATASALAALPPVALRLADETLDLLARLGIDTIGALAALPRAPLARRFGRGLLSRLDQATGDVVEPLDWLVLPTALSARIALFEPLTDGLARLVATLAVQLCAMLEAQGLGARTLDLACTRVDGVVQQLRVGTARPSRDAAHLAALFGEQLDHIDPGFGIESVALAAVRAEPLAPQQLGEGAAVAQQLPALVDRLVSRLGARNVYRCTPRASDIPERAVERIAPLAPPQGRGWPRWPRPPRLFDPPEPVEALAMLPDSPPARFIWRGVARRIAHADGPERIYGEWWLDGAEAASVRDYFQVEDSDGERFWLFRAGDGVDPASGAMRWFVQGRW